MVTSVLDGGLKGATMPQNSSTGKLPWMKPNVNRTLILASFSDWFVLQLGNEIKNPCERWGRKSVRYYFSNIYKILFSIIAYMMYMRLSYNCYVLFVCDDYWFSSFFNCWVGFLFFNRSVRVNEVEELISFLLRKTSN